MNILVKAIYNIRTDDETKKFTALRQLHTMLNAQLTGKESLRDGEAIRDIINASHRVAFRKILQLDLYISCIKSASFIKKYWSKYYDLGFGLIYSHLMNETA